MSDTIILSKEAAVRQREAIRLLSEENRELQAQAAARLKLTKESAERAAAALATAGHIHAADRDNTAKLLVSNPNSIVEIMEKMATEAAAAPVRLGHADKSAARTVDKPPTADEIWDRGFNFR